MLLEFKVGNFQCFHEEQTLSMIPAGRDQNLRGNLFQGHRTKTTKAAAIFGHNASGKTSFLHALFVMGWYVNNSATTMTHGNLLPAIDPFRLASDASEAPSTFEVTVELDGTQYRYRIEATSKHVNRELLACQAPNKGARWITLIDRDMTREEPADQIKLHELIGDSSRRTGIQNDTRDNGLVLSRAAERNAEIVHPLQQWFQNGIRFISMPLLPTDPTALLRKAARIASADELFLQRLNQLIRDADTGIARIEPERFERRITGIQFKEDPSEFLNEESKSRLDALSAAISNQAQSKDEAGENRYIHGFSTYHTNTETNELVRFSIEDESSGTILFLAMASNLLLSCHFGILLIIDELDASLHPNLARRLIQLIQSPEFNKSGTQLIFSTHDTSLMDANLLRRDQIWLTEKNPAGESELFSLWDIKDMPPPRGNTALAQNYLAGRYGGAPTFGPTLEDIPQADEPTKIEVE